MPSRLASARAKRRLATRGQAHGYEEGRLGEPPSMRPREIEVSSRLGDQARLIRRSLGLCQTEAAHLAAHVCSVARIEIEQRQQF